MTRQLTTALVALTVIGCADAVAPTPAPPALAVVALPDAGARGLTVMTRNLYLGADLFAVVEGDPRQLPLRVIQAWQHILMMNFPERAGSIADEIAATSPELIGLQEVPLYRIDPTGDAAFGGTNPATVVALDYLTTLQSALAARGQCYNAVASNSLTDVELPAIVSASPLRFIDIRYTDRDVILARCDVPTSDAQSGVYTAKVVFTVGPTSIPAPRGWTSTLATVGGVTFRFANTHLETDGSPAIQVAQANELLGVLAAESNPVVLVCDCNSAADGSQTATYGLLTGSGGFADAWSEAHPRDPGYTSSLPDGFFTDPLLRTRIDLVLARYGFNASPNAGIVGGVHADVVGETSAERTASGLWPSDHAGVVATLNMPKAIGK
ncbi:MAG TPA: endonuclease/exonuclease/phosphatase family protein [Gemmatimonadaceae bacterium]|jgi:endonuclease/exonuclease/phosphatase family metal-dependent hydrolase|nr:endonuclease/exonuclease/phosphatase family protein [Gemmatimonadaceae bacterium]